MKRTRNFLVAVGALIGAAALLCWVVDWRSLAEQKLIAVLQEKGFPDAQLKVKDIGLFSVTLESVTLGGPVPLALNALKLHFSPQQLWQGRLNEVNLSGVALKWGDVEITSRETVFKTAPDGSGEWKGTWASKAITVAGLPVSIPGTESSGKWAVNPDKLVLKGIWGTPDKTYHADFTLNYFPADVAGSETMLHSFTMPWGGGSIALKDAIIPFAKKAYNLAVMVKAVSVDAVLQPLTGNRATATGTVSGALPFTLNVDGGFTPRSGALKAEGPGKIVMQPDAIPGDNAQVDMLREVMKDFHYNTLSLSVDNDAKNKLSVGLTLEGKNPAAYDGRPVKLNVHLSGDVLDFVQQSMTVHDPHKLLKDTGKHAQ